MLDNRKSLALILIALCLPVVIIPYATQLVELSALVNTLVGVLVSALLAGAVILWISSDQVERKKERIWKAIEKWVNAPITRFHDQQDTLPFAEKPPELAFEIEECLKQNYPAIWDNLQKLKQEYHGWKNEDVGKRFTENINGIPTLHYDMFRWYNESTCRRLIELHHQMAKQIKSEILEKYHTRLKC